MEYTKDIIHYFKDTDKGIGLDLEPDNKVSVLFTDDKQIDEVFATTLNNVFFVSENIQK